jgi:hypothetical protein
MPVADYIRCSVIGGNDMARERARHGTFLFQRPESTNWWIKLRSRFGRVEKSLGTSDKAVAELLALPMIAAAARSRAHVARAARPLAQGNTQR